MKIFRQTYFLALLMTSSLFLFSCSKDDDPQPKDNIPLEVGGTMMAVVNGETVNYTDVRIGVYGLSNTVGIMGHQQVEEHRRDRVRVVIPLEPTTGTFNYNESPFQINYEAIMGSSEGGVGFNRDATGQINVLEYKLIGTSGGENYYRVKGRFERFGMHNFNSETVNIENGEFDFVYSY